MLLLQVVLQVQRTNREVCKSQQHISCEQTAKWKPGISDRDATKTTRGMETVLFLKHELGTVTKREFVVWKKQKSELYYKNSFDRYIFVDAENIFSKDSKFRQSSGVYH